MSDSSTQPELSVATNRDAVADLQLLSGTATGSKKSSSSSWWTPSFADLFVVALIVWTFASGPYGWSGLLTDGDAGWHIRTGETILDTGSVPRTDPYSFSKFGQPWFAWEWLSDVGMALLHRAGGLKAVVWFAGLLIAAFAGVLLRYMMWKGSNPFAALILTLIATGACSIHFLARPHLTTLLFIPIVAWTIEADRLRNTNKIWALVPLFILWTNLHGGFLAGILLLGATAVGVAIEERKFWSPTIGRYTLLTALCAAATVVNPYGIALHQHVGAYLQSDWIRSAVQEFQSPTFRGESAMQFEALLFLGLVSAAFLLARGKVVETLWIAGFAHMALGSQRHITIFASIATPFVAAQLTAWWESYAKGQSRKSVAAILQQMSVDRAPAFARNSAWAIVFFAALLAFDGPQMHWPKDFTSVMFPVETMQKYRAKIQTSRLLTTDQWGDYLLYHNYPQQRVFVDGRSDFFGPEIGKDYVHLLSGLHNWETLMNKYGFDLVIAPVDWPLNSLLKRDSRWKLLEDNGKTLVFERLGGTAYTAGGRNQSPTDRAGISN